MIKLVKVAKVALVLASISFGQARSHSDKPGNHGLRNAADRYLAKGGNGGGGGGGKPNGGGDDGATSSACSFVGSACCEGPKVKGRICDTTSISSLDCMKGLCLPAEQRAQSDPLPPQCVASRCGIPVGDFNYNGCSSDTGCEGEAVCDTCAPTTCESILIDSTCTVPDDFDSESFWPCCGKCVSNQCCEIGPEQIYCY